MSTSSTGCDTQGDRENCGACGHTCDATYDCVEGRCADEVKLVVSGVADCAILVGGEMWCWGPNALGLLGDKTFGGTLKCPDPNTGSFCRPEPAKVLDLDPVEHADISYGHACAVTSAGFVFCWGRNDRGELGSQSGLDTCDLGGGMTTPCTAVPHPVPIPGTPKMTKVTVGLGYTCALSAQGGVYCWGDNRVGQLGSSPSVAPSPPAKVQGLGTATDLSTNGDEYPLVCAIVAGGAWCWGASTAGGSGHDPALDMACGATTCDPAPKQVMTAAGPLEGLVEIGVGRGWGCALDGNGAVWCWGGDGHGQQGNGAAVKTAPHLATQVPGLPPIASLATTPDGTIFVVDQEGGVHAWGRDTSAEIGDGVLGASGCSGACEPSPIDMGLDNVIQVGAGLGPMLALKKDGRVVTWGYNSYAGLGHPPTQSEKVNGAYLNPVPGELMGLP